MKKLEYNEGCYLLILLLPNSLIMLKGEER